MVDDYEQTGTVNLDSLVFAPQVYLISIINIFCSTIHRNYDCTLSQNVLRLLKQKRLKKLCLLHSTVYYD